MTLTPAQIDRIASDLKSLLRVERKSRKVKKLDGGFYKEVIDALETLRAEAERSLKDQDITNYININKRIQDIEHDFKDFFQKRFSKMAILSLYELDADLMNSLTAEERDFMTRLHNMMQDEYNKLLLKERAVREEEVEEAGAVVEAHENEATEEAAAGKETEAPREEHFEGGYQLLRIIGDQPPIALPDRDYYLHDNDLVYLPDRYAEMLIKRKVAVKVSIAASKA